jgi:hypothetical protein
MEGNNTPPREPAMRVPRITRHARETIVVCLTGLSSLRAADENSGRARELLAGNAVPAAREAG